MKRKSKKQAEPLLSKLIEEAEDGEVISLESDTYVIGDAEDEPKKPDTQPLDTESYVKFVKCIYSGPVNVNNAPSGKEYKFQPGQTLPVRNPEDYHHLMSLKRNPGPGCCSGSPYEPTMYFDVASFDKEN